MRTASFRLWRIRMDDHLHVLLPCLMTYPLPYAFVLQYLKKAFQEGENFYEKERQGRQEHSPAEGGSRSAACHSSIVQRGHMHNGRG